ncbi:MAG: Holliday junction resolvase RuvX, partial [Clostridia bacterium]|nr:Holliday junction resolvase RuvX [Clostridia bacterium]
MQILKQTKGKLLGVDFGDKRTGIAVSDSLRTMASGRQTISVGGMEKT